MIFVFLLIGILAVALSSFLWLSLNRINIRSERVTEISRLIYQGARVFLIRQMTIIWILVSVISLLLLFLSDYFEATGFFLLGALIASLAGLSGVFVASKVNPRTAELAQDDFRKSFQAALSGGQSVSLFSIGLGLIGLILVYSLAPEPFLLIYYVFGASLVAFFMRIGGGIYTKSADISADLAGKQEERLPEDDSRNPAVVADQVGDQVGDLAGTATDLLETYLSSVAAAMILGWVSLGSNGLVFPLWLASLGLLASLIGGFAVRLGGAGDKNLVREAKRIRRAIRRGKFLTFFLFMVGAMVLSVRFLNDWRYFFIVLTGSLVGLMISALSGFYTMPGGRMVNRTVKAAQSGSAAVISEGLSAGFIGVLGPALIISLALAGVYSLGGFYGIALAAVGLISILAIELSASCFGPIVDNARGIVRAANLGEEARSRTEALDSAGNSVAAVGKGFAIAAAAFTVLVWLSIYLKTALSEDVSFLNSSVLIGIFLGASLVFFFSALIIRSVNSGARKLSDWIRGQIGSGASPDYIQPVILATDHSLKGLVGPGLIALAVPLLAGWYLGPEAMGGILVGSLASAFPLALFMAYSGAIWDNAKKQAEGDDSILQAVSVGDLVGDPLKDAAAPALNILIKLMGVVTLIFVFLFV